MIKRFLYLPAFLGYAIHVLWHLGKESNSAFQDDMRQHVLGFHHMPDFFGRYFSATIPLGIGWLNQLTSLVVTPLTWARWIQPFLIGLLLTYFSWHLGKRFFLGEKGEKAEEKTFLFVILLQALVWSGDDLISSTPRSWAVLCVVALLEACLSGQMLRLIVILFLTALFYSPLAIIGFGLFVLLQLDLYLIQKKKPLNRLNFFLIVVTLAGLYGIAHYQSKRLALYGPTITRKEAEVLPEFNPGGRAHYFSDNFIDFWINNSRGGLIPRDTQVAWALLGVALLFAWYKISFGKLMSDRQKFWIGGLFLGSLLLFFLAHIFWFRLFHPNRYVQFVILVMACLMASEVFGRKRLIYFTLPPVLFLINYTLANQNYHHEGEASLIKAEIRNTPQPVLAVFPVSDLGNALPLLEQLPIVASEELSLPYHQTFYQQARDRLTDTYSLWITTDRDEIVRYFDKYSVTHILLERETWREKTNLSEPWHSIYHQRLTSETSLPLLKRILGKKKKKFFSRVELFNEINQSSF